MLTQQLFPPTKLRKDFYIWVVSRELCQWSRRLERARRSLGAVWHQEVRERIGTVAKIFFIWVTSRELCQRSRRMDHISCSNNWKRHAYCCQQQSNVNWRISDNRNITPSPPKNSHLRRLNIAGHFCRQRYHCNVKGSHSCRYSLMFSVFFFGRCKK